VGLLAVAFGVRLFAVAFGGLLVLGLLVLGLALAFGVDLHALPCVDLLAAPTLLGPFALRSESPGGGVARRRLWRFWRLCAGMGCEEQRATDERETGNPVGQRSEHRFSRGFERRRRYAGTYALGMGVGRTRCLYHSETRTARLSALRTRAPARAHGRATRAHASAFRGSSASPE